MIELSNGQRIEIVAASGAFGFNGKGHLPDRILAAIRYLDFSTIDVAVTKTFTRDPKKGRYRWYQPWKSIRFIKGGVANAVKLTNPGIEWWCQKVGPKLDSLKISLIVSIAGDADEIKEMVEMLNEFKGIIAIEINMGCPNVCSDWNTDEVIKICKVAKENSRHPIILKLSVAHNIEAIIPYIEGFIEAISINSVPWSIAFPKQENPFIRYGIEECGVSGKIIQPYTWPFADKISQMTSIPIIWPSIYEFSEIERLRRIAAARAFSFGSIFFYPWKLRRILKDIKKN